MSVSAPPRPPRPGDPISREEAEALVEALIEEARQRARRRRQKYAAFAMVATLAAVVVTTVLERSTGAESQSPALAARSALAAGAADSKIVFTSFVVNPERTRPRYAATIYVMNADGSGERRLARGSGPPGRRTGGASPSPTSAKGNAEAYVMNADGSGLRNVSVTRRTTAASHLVAGRAEDRLRSLARRAENPPSPGQATSTS